MPNRELDTAYYALSRRMARVERQSTRMATHQTWTGRTAIEEYLTPPGNIAISLGNSASPWANAIAGNRLFLNPLTLNPGSWAIFYSSIASFRDTSVANDAWYINFALYSAATGPLVLGSHASASRVSSVFTQQEYNVFMTRIITLTSITNIELIGEGYAASGGPGNGFWLGSTLTAIQPHRLVAIPV